MRVFSVLLFSHQGGCVHLSPTSSAKNEATGFDRIEGPANAITVQELLCIPSNCETSQAAFALRDTTVQIADQKDAISKKIRNGDPLDYTVFPGLRRFESSNSRYETKNSSGFISRAKISEFHQHDGTNTLKPKSNKHEEAPFCGDELWGYLTAVADYLEKHGFEYWVYYGTLLGGKRDQNIIPWTADIDFVVTQQGFDGLRDADPQTEMRGLDLAEESPGLLRGCQQHNSIPAESQHHSIPAESQSRGVPFAYNVAGLRYVDIYHRDKFHLFTDFDRQHLNVANATKVTIRGRAFTAPANPDELLTHRYGDWRTPDPKQQKHGAAWDMIFTSVGDISQSSAMGLSMEAPDLEELYYNGLLKSFHHKINFQISSEKSFSTTVSIISWSLIFCAFFMIGTKIYTSTRGWTRTRLIGEIQEVLNKYYVNTSSTEVETENDVDSRENLLSIRTISHDPLAEIGNKSPKMTPTTSHSDGVNTGGTTLNTVPSSDDVSLRMFLITTIVFSKKTLIFMGHQLSLLFSLIALSKSPTSPAYRDGLVLWWTGLKLLGAFLITWKFDSTYSFREVFEKLVGRRESRAVVAVDGGGHYQTSFLDSPRQFLYENRHIMFAYVPISFLVTVIDLVISGVINKDTCDPFFFMIVTNFRVVLIALVNWVMRGEKFHPFQIYGLFMIAHAGIVCSGLLLFKGDNNGDSGSDDSGGDQASFLSAQTTLVLIFVSEICACCALVYQEKVLKRYESVPVMQQNIFLYGIMMFIALPTMIMVQRYFILPLLVNAKTTRFTTPDTTVFTSNTPVVDGAASYYAVSSSGETSSSSLKGAYTSGQLLSSRTSSNPSRWGTTIANPSLITSYGTTAFLETSMISSVRNTVGNRTTYSFLETSMSTTSVNNHSVMGRVLDSSAIDKDFDNLWTYVRSVPSDPNASLAVIAFAGLGLVISVFLRYLGSVSLCISRIISMIILGMVATNIDLFPIPTIVSEVLLVSAGIFFSKFKWD